MPGICPSKVSRASTIAVAIVLAAIFLSLQFQPTPGCFSGGATQFSDQRFFGWPRVMLDRTTTRTVQNRRGLWPLDTFATETAKNSWSGGNVAVNLVLCVALLASTTIYVDSMLHRDFRQFEIKHIALAMLVVSLWCGVLFQ